jgi:hypothetical protein
VPFSDVISIHIGRGVCLVTNNMHLPLMRHLRSLRTQLFIGGKNDFQISGALSVILKPIIAS